MKKLKSPWQSLSTVPLYQNVLLVSEDGDGEVDYFYSRPTEDFKMAYTEKIAVAWMPLPELYEDEL